MNRFESWRRFLNVFYAEWKSLGAAARLPNSFARTSGGEYDPAPAPGEVRLFADFAEPFTGVVLDGFGGGRLVVPVSPFSVPVIDRELLVGERPLQLWNAFVAPADVVARGWRVDSLGEADLEDVREALCRLRAGRPLPPDLAACAGAPAAVARDGRVADYLRVQSHPLAGFRRLFAPPSAVRRRPVAVWWAAAALALVGVGLAWIGADRAADPGRPLAKYRFFDLRRMRGDDVVAGEQLVALPDVADEEVGADPGMRPPELQVADYAAVPAPAPAVALAPPETVAAASPAAAEDAAAAATPARFEQTVERDFVDPREEPLSTFGLGADTASYTFFRRAVAGRRLPPPESVRAEQFVNYFHYSYPQPAGADRLALDCELSECPWDGRHQLLRVGVQAKDLGEDAPPCNLVFVVDNSASSAAGGAFDAALASLRAAAGSLRAVDHVAIVSCGGGARLALPSVRGTERRRIAEAVSALRVAGVAAAGEGLRLAYDEIARHRRRGANSRVVLVSSGAFGAAESAAELARLVSDRRASGVSFSVIGVGDGVQEQVLAGLARAGNGSCRFVDGADEARKALFEEFLGAFAAAAKDVKLQLEFNPALVSGYRLVGYERRALSGRDYNDDRKPAGELGSGQAVTALYEIVPAGAGGLPVYADGLKYQRRETLASEELMTVRVRYRLPDDSAGKKLEQAFRPADLRRERPSDDFAFASAVAEAALIMGDSPFRGDASWKALIARARAARGADPDGSRAEFIRLAEAAAALQRRR